MSQGDALQVDLGKPGTAEQLPPRPRCSLLALAQVSVTVWNWCCVSAAHANVPRVLAAAGEQGKQNGNLSGDRNLGCNPPKQPWSPSRRETVRKNLLGSNPWTPVPNCCTALL